MRVANKKNLGCVNNVFLNYFTFRYLSEELKYVDKTKVALVGEDEGGYTAGMVYLADIEAAGSEPTITKCVVYVSPTVNWKLTGNI